MCWLCIGDIVGKNGTEITRYLCVADGFKAKQKPDCINTKRYTYMCVYGRRGKIRIGKKRTQGS